MTDTNEQSFLWQQRTNQQLFAELCNALYERELTRLSQDEQLSLEGYKKKMASLSYYIKKAAQHIVDLYAPMDLDSQNGSWICNQSAKPLSIKSKQEACTEFYHKHAKMALVVPVSINHYGIEQIVLDTIDEVDFENRRLHCNEHGWFLFDGEGQSHSQAYVKQLLKPVKATMTAACCGHQWLNSKKTSSRLLSLREMLLATRINWQHFSKLAVIKSK